MPYTRSADEYRHRAVYTPMKKSQEKRLHLAILKQMVTLTSSGFGLVAALAWNNVIQDLVNNYIKRYLPQGSGLMSLFLYAVLITTFAVILTYNLTALVEKLESLGTKPPIEK